MFQKRFEAYGWYVLKVDDGNNTKLISEAISQAMKITPNQVLL
jgi:Transketolase